MTSPDTSSPPGSLPPAPPVVVRRTPGWVRILLFLSLALNLAVFGVVAGAIMKRHAPPGMAPPRDGATALYLRALPDDQRAAFDEGMRREGGRFRIDRATLRAEINATLDVLRADPFDAEAFSQRIADQRRTLSERVSSGDRLLMERLVAMSPDERRAYADRLQTFVDRFARHGRD